MKNFKIKKPLKIILEILFILLLGLDIAVGIEYCIVYHLNFIEIVSAFSAVLFLVGLGWVDSFTLKGGDY